MASVCDPSGYVTYEQLSDTEDGSPVLRIGDLIVAGIAQDDPHETVLVVVPGSAVADVVEAAQELFPENSRISEQALDGTLRFFRIVNVDMPTESNVLDVVVVDPEEWDELVAERRRIPEIRYLSEDDMWTVADPDGSMRLAIQVDDADAVVLTYGQIAAFAQRTEAVRSRRAPHALGQRVEDLLRVVNDEARARDPEGPYVLNRRAFEAAAESGIDSFPNLAALFVPSDPRDRMTGEEVFLLERHAAGSLYDVASGVVRALSIAATENADVVMFTGATGPVHAHIAREVLSRMKHRLGGISVPRVVDAGENSRTLPEIHVDSSTNIVVIEDPDDEAQPSPSFQARIEAAFAEATVTRAKAFDVSMDPYEVGDLRELDGEIASLASLMADHLTVSHERRTRSDGTPDTPDTPDTPGSTGPIGW